MKVLPDLFYVIAVGLADEPDDIRQQDVAFCFHRFVFLSLLVFFMGHPSYFSKTRAGRAFSLPAQFISASIPIIVLV